MKRFLVCFLVFLLGSTFVSNCGLTMPPSAPKNEPDPMGSKPPSSPMPAAGEAVSMRVLWTVSEYKIGKGVAWGEEEAREMLFKPLDMDETSITFDGQTCSNITFRKDTVDAREYFRAAWSIAPRDLGIEDETVQVIRTTCELPGFAEYIRLQDRRLIIYINGIFFYFSPAVNY